MRESLPPASDPDFAGAVRFRAVVRGVPEATMVVPLGSSGATEMPSLAAKRATAPEVTYPSGIGIRIDSSPSRSTRPQSNSDARQPEGAEERPSATSCRTAAWTSGELARALVFVIYITLQATVPLRAFVADIGHDRYSWRMYSQLLIHPEWVVTLRDGSNGSIPIGEYSIHPRGEIDWESHYPAHICSVVSGAREVWRPATQFTPEVHFECQ